MWKPIEPIMWRSRKKSFLFIPYLQYTALMQHSFTGETQWRPISMADIIYHGETN
jgi:hypothetical protein